MVTSRPARRDHRALPLALIAAVAAILLVAGFDLDLLMVLPALATAALVLAWPSPGIELILRIAARRPATRRRRSAAAGWRPTTVATRGGRLIAASLGGRAPPPRALRP